MIQVTSTSALVRNLALGEKELITLVGAGGKTTLMYALAQKLLSRDLPTLWGTDLHRVEQLQRYIVPGLAVLAKHGVQINAVLDSLSSNSAPQ